MSGNTYFEEIGVWPEKSGKIIRAYVIGYALSILLTLAAYFLVVHEALPREFLFGTIIFLALAQFVVQLVCFLHLSTERSARERLVVLCCASIIVLILVSGSLWIMITLNGRMMPNTAQMEQYMDDQSGF